MSTLRCEEMYKRPWKSPQGCAGLFLNNASGWHVESYRQIFNRPPCRRVQEESFYCNSKLGGGGGFVAWLKLKGRFSCKALKTLKQCCSCTISKLKCLCPDYPLIPGFKGINILGEKKVNWPQLTYSKLLQSNPVIFSILCFTAYKSLYYLFIFFT